MEHYDIIFIGSGTGGGTFTWKLASTGKRILLIERGPYGTFSLADLARIGQKLFLVGTR